MWKQIIVETERGAFEVFECGEGEPLAVTHLYSEFDERGNALAHPFTPYYKVFLINLRGAGRSVKASDPQEYRMDYTVADLEAIRESLGFQKWAFAGHSTGGMLGLTYATIAPQSLSKLIAGGAAASYEYAAHPDCMYHHKNKNFTRITEIMDALNDSATPVEVRQALSYEWSLMSYHSEEKLKEALKKPNSGRTIGERLDFFRKVEYKDYDVRNELKNVHLPCFIYAGRHDAQCPVQFGIEIAELLPNAQLTIFEKSNHFPFLEEEAAFQAFVTSTLHPHSQLLS
ncbi:MAG: alpha/beta fold hydrolase [Lysinibacillus sp.]